MYSRTCPRALLHSARLSRSFSSKVSPSIPRRTILRTPSKTSIIPSRHFHPSAYQYKGLQPDTEEPTPPQPEPDVAGGATHVTKPADISIDEYHELSDSTIEDLMARLEVLAEDPEKGIEVEYSVCLSTTSLPQSPYSYRRTDKRIFKGGVLTLQTPAGTYVLNKQPPNKQVWISSPISGPKRYDWVYTGDSQQQKEGTVEGPVGSWIYLRDGSSLAGLLKKEVGVDLDGAEGEESVQ
ncbi:MAG: hypothetical protein Q9227_006439 [Pyrenula ochraceoflavens]